MSEVDNIPSAAGSSSVAGGSNGGAGGANCVDADGDGYCAVSTKLQDCDDSDPDRHPDAAEICNLKDDNCDGTIDEGAPAACQFTCEAPKAGCETMTAIVAGVLHACALSSSGGVYCWGSNAGGGLGSPELSNSTLPVAVPGISGATGLVGSGYSTCALDKEFATCWGAGSEMPFRIPLPPSAKQVAVTASIIYALLDNGTVMYRALLPTGEAPLEFSELTVTDQPTVAISAGAARLCALDSAGTLACASGEQKFDVAITGVTTGTVTIDGTVCYTTSGELHCVDDAAIPRIDDGGDRVIAGNGSAIGVVKSGGYACAFAASGKAACWTAGGPTTITDAQQLAVGLEFGCVLRKSGTVSCWGSDINGSLGDGRIGSYTEMEPVDVKPGPELALPGPILLGSTKLGACDSLPDVSLIADASGTGRVHSLFRDCSTQCQNTLDSATCFAGCAKNPGLSAGCFSCFAQLASCTGADCYAAFNTCAGFSIDYLATIYNEPRFECPGAKCLIGEPLGHDCKNGKDCLSGACDTLPQFKDHAVCVSSDGASCFGAVGSCNCGEGYCGSCSGLGRIASSAGDCFRDCTSSNYCEAGQMCEFFSDFEHKHCQ
ncbi:MAG: MopE-related protein [Pseudomonadota bacterium]